MHRKFETLNLLDQKIQKTIRTGMTDGELLTIKYVSGFEEFDCYETWCQGWVVSGKGTGDKEITARHSALDTAIDRWIKEYNEANPK